MRETFKENKLYFYSIIALVIIVPLAIVAAVIVSIEEQEKDAQEVTNTLPAITWDIEKIESNQDNPQNFNVELRSNAGTIQNFNNVLSFGMSNNGELFATRTTNGLSISNLNEDTRESVVISEESYVGDTGNSITWSYNDEYLAFTTVNTNNLNDTRIWVVPINTLEPRFVEASLIVRQTDAKVIVGEVLFSPYNNLLLTRTFRAEDRLELNSDNAEYQLTELPVVLEIFNVNGQSISTNEIRGFDETGTQIYYNWDVENAAFIEYGVFDADKTIDPTDDTNITRIRF